MRLSPPELGSMKLELTVRDGVMTARVQTETDSARNMLLDHLPALRERLADHNITIERFDVDLNNPSGGGTARTRPAIRTPDIRSRKALRGADKSKRKPLLPRPSLAHAAVRPLGNWISPFNGKQAARELFSVLNRYVKQKD